MGLHHCKAVGRSNEGHYMYETTTKSLRGGRCQKMMRAKGIDREEDHQKMHRTNTLMRESMVPKLAGTVPVRPHEAKTLTHGGKIEGEVRHLSSGEGCQRSLRCRSANCAFWSVMCGYTSRAVLVDTWNHRFDTSEPKRTGK